MKSKGFTLIELLAVIVILAIIALIVTPIVSNIITSARNAANARSVEGHIRNIELAIIGEAFNNGSDDLSKYDNGNISSLTLPSNDKITCSSYTIENGNVIEATGCTNTGWTNTFGYTKTNGAKVTGDNANSSTPVETACTWRDFYSPLINEVYSLVSNEYGDEVQQFIPGTPDPDRPLTSWEHTFYLNDGTVNPYSEWENNNYQLPDDPHYIKFNLTCESTASQIFNAIKTWHDGLS